jgi:lipocalin
LATPHRQANSRLRRNLKSQIGTAEATESTKDKKLCSPFFGHQPSPHICHSHCIIQTKAKSSRFLVASGELQHLWNYEESRDILNLEKLVLLKTYNSYSKKLILDF